MEKNILLVDNIEGTILEFSESLELEILQEKHLEYKDCYTIFGRDYVNGYKVWFIKDVQDSDFTRLALETKILNYLLRK